MIDLERTMMIKVTKFNMEKPLWTYSQEAMSQGVCQDEIISAVENANATMPELKSFYTEVKVEEVFIPRIKS